MTEALPHHARPRPRLLEAVGADGTDTKKNENADPEWKISAGVSRTRSRRTRVPRLVGSARDGFGVSFVRAPSTRCLFLERLERERLDDADVQSRRTLAAAHRAARHRWAANQAALAARARASRVGGSREIVVTVCGDREHEGEGHSNLETDDRASFCATW